MCGWIKQLIPRPPERNILSARFSFPVSLWQGEKKKKDALRGDGGFVAPETEDTAALFEDIYGILPISPPPAFIFCRSSFIISDLIKPRRAACSAMKHLLAVCNEIVVREAR